MTVSNDEVAAVVIKSSKFRDKFRKGIKSISHKLHVFAAGGRSRSRSIGDVDSAATSAHTYVTPSTAAGQISLHNTPQSKPVLPGFNSHAAYVGNEHAPVLSPPASLSRRFSVLGSKTQDVVQYPRHPVIQLASPNLNPPNLHSAAMPLYRAAQEDVTREPGNTSIQTANRGFVVHRNQSPHLVPPVRSEIPPNTAAPVHIARPTASSSSLDKLRWNAGDVSPTTNLRRRQASDIDGRGLQRAPSDASSMGSGFGSKLVKLLSRNSSHRSRLRKRDKPASGSSDVDEAVTLSTGDSPVEVIHRISLDEGLPTRSMEAFTSSPHSPPLAALHIGDRGDRPRASTWEARLRNGPAIRRGSGLSEGFTRDVDEEEIDWNEPLSDDDEYDGPPTKTGLTNSAPNLPLNWHQRGDDTLGLVDEPHPIPQTASIAPSLDSIPDASPPPMNARYNESGSELSNPAPSTPSLAPEFGYRSSSRPNTKVTHSPLRLIFASERTGSPLRAGEDPTTSPKRLGLSRQTSDPVLEDDEADEGLAISVGSRRGRKGSIFGKKSISEE